MKKIALIILLIGWLSTAAFAVCDGEPAIDATGKILKELKLKESRIKSSGKAAESEIGLSVKASVKGAAWRTKGAEAAVLTVFVDGKYNQDVILFAGAETFEYKMLLGKFDSGAHRVAIVLNKNRSAPNVSDVKIHAAFADFYQDSPISKSADRSASAYLATINAPVIYLRSDTIDKFSDVPLLTYYEIFDEPEGIKKIRYTTIFTNEDGGTQSAALMARWGRMTDIEWIYEIRIKENGEIISEIFQGANHETKNFSGKRFGSHPLLSDATVNNNFSDAGCTPLRVSPMLVRADLTNGSRETVMDEFAWTYRIMAEEAVREGRVNPANLGANTIADPRDYIYAEIYSEPENAAIALEAELPDGKTISSDSGDKSLRVSRKGFVRIALRLPPEFTKTSPPLAVRCYAVLTEKEVTCRNVNLTKIVRLDRNYFPRQIKINAKPQTLKTGEAAKFDTPSNR